MPGNVRCAQGYESWLKHTGPYNKLAKTVLGTTQVRTRFTKTVFVHRANVKL